MSWHEDSRLPFWVGHPLFRADPRPLFAEQAPRWSWQNCWRCGCLHRMSMALVCGSRIVWCPECSRREDEWEAEQVLRALQAAGEVAP